MQMSESHANIAAALAKFQGLKVNPPKNKTAVVKSKRTGSEYSYKYADLADILECNKKQLADCGIVPLQDEVEEQNGKIGVYTMLLHESGEFIKFKPVFVPAAPANPQEKGSALTYARRYSMSLALGIAADEDKDAADLQSTPQEQKQTHGKKPREQEQQPERNEQPKQGQTERKLSDKQLNKIFIEAQARDLNDNAQRALIYKHFGKKSRKDLSTQEASKFINMLMKAPDEQLWKDIKSVLNPKSDNVVDFNQKKSSEEKSAGSVDKSEFKGRQITSDEDIEKALGLRSKEELNEEIRQTMAKEGEENGDQSAASS